MNDNRSRDIFYGVVAVATLIIALVGATLAYFSISSSSDEGAVAAKAATVSINYEDGKEVIAQADELIPATWDVVSSVYLDRTDELEHDWEDTDTPINERGGWCIDSNGREVCSVYRFSISSDQPRTISARLNPETNEFSWLAYAVRDVTNQTWITLEGNSETLGVDKCDGAEGETPCYSMTDGIKSYLHTHSLFGYDSSANELTKTVAATAQVYDIVLFIKENTHDQNIDQGKSFRGTIVIDVIDNGTGRVTGEWTPRP